MSNLPVPSQPEPNLPALRPAEETALVRGIVDDSIRRYIASRRALIPAFVDRHFSLRGTLALHRAALGWDMARAPLNLAMAAPQVGLLLAAQGARRLGANRLAGQISSKRLTVQTAVAREVAWLVHTELLGLPYRDGKRESTTDALAESILNDPRLAEALHPVVMAIHEHQRDPALRQRIEADILRYTGTRTAAADITTSLFNLAAGASALHKFTPGALTLGPAVAGALARHAAMASFPLGSGLGSLWYGLFPAAAPSALLTMSLTGGLLAAGSVAAAFAGLVSDPVQRRLGLHQRRLQRLLDALQSGLLNPGAPEFAVHDHYVARVLDLVDMIGSVARVVRK